jgi:hypothetical protein
VWRLDRHDFMDAARVFPKLAHSEVRGG